MTLEYYNQEDPNTITITLKEYKELTQDSKTLQILRREAEYALSHPITNLSVNQE
jgi:hypothetical protein